LEAEFAVLRQTPTSAQMCNKIPLLCVCIGISHIE